MWEQELEQEEIMAVRNFWVNGKVDGRSTGFGGGPQRKDGGFSMTVKQRDKGEIVTAARIEGFVTSSGELILMVDVEGHDVVQFVTER